MSNERRINYGVVYDKDGNPKVDDPQTVPDVVWDQFTDLQKNHINSKLPEHLRRWD